MLNNQNPLVSVIMNCHNGEKYLDESLKSLFDQSYYNWELIFWDNFSSDKSFEILNSYQDKRIRYFKSVKFEKLYKARNLAISKTLGNFICFLDSDDIWDKNFLVKHINTAIKYNCNITYSKFLIKNEINKKTYVNFVNKLPAGEITNDLLKRYSVGISAILLKKKIFEKFEFNPDYQIIGDFDLFLRLSLVEKFHPIQEPLLTYRHHADNFSNKNLNIYINELENWLKKNEYSFYKKKNFFFLKFYIFKLKIKNYLKILKTK